MESRASLIDIQSESASKRLMLLMMVVMMMMMMAIVVLMKSEYAFLWGGGSRSAAHYHLSTLAVLLTLSTYLVQLTQPPQPSLDR